MCVSATPSLLMKDLTQALVGCLTPGFSDYWYDQLSSTTAILPCVTLSVATLLAWHRSQSQCCADTFNSLRPIAHMLYSSFALLGQIIELQWSPLQQALMKSHLPDTVQLDCLSATATNYCFDRHNLVHAISLAGTARSITSHAASHLSSHYPQGNAMAPNARGEVYLTGPLKQPPRALMRSWTGSPDAS